MYTGNASRSTSIIPGDVEVRFRSIGVGLLIVGSVSRFESCMQTVLIEWFVWRLPVSEMLNADPSPVQVGAVRLRTMFDTPDGNWNLKQWSRSLLHRIMTLDNWQANGSNWYIRAVPPNSFANEQMEPKRKRIHAEIQYWANFVPFPFVLQNIRRKYNRKCHNSTGKYSISVQTWNSLAHCKWRNNHTWILRINSIRVRWMIFTQIFTVMCLRCAVCRAEQHNNRLSTSGNLPCFKSEHNINTEPECCLTGRLGNEGGRQRNIQSNQNGEKLFVSLGVSSAGMRSIAKRMQKPLSNTPRSRSPDSPLASKPWIRPFQLDWHQRQSSIAASRTPMDKFSPGMFCSNHN